MTRDTVMVETPARAATSEIVGAPLWRALRALGFLLLSRMLRLMKHLRQPPPSPQRVANVKNFQMAHLESK